MTETEQLAPAAVRVVHVLVWLKSLELTPEIPTPATVNGPLPVFVIVTAIAGLAVLTVWDGNAKEAGETTATGCAGAEPVPSNVTSCGVPLALSAIINNAVRGPKLDGLNATVTTQLPAVAKLPAQVFVWEKSEPFMPDRETWLIDTAVVPVLLRYTD
jgi:hypothetical protein